MSKLCSKEEASKPASPTDFVKKFFCDNPEQRARVAKYMKDGFKPPWQLKQLAAELTIEAMEAVLSREEIARAGGAEGQCDFEEIVRFLQTDEGNQ